MAHADTSEGGREALEIGSCIRAAASAARPPELHGSMSHYCKVGAAAALIASCWTASVFSTKHLQSECGYSRPYLEK